MLGLQSPYPQPQKYTTTSWRAALSLQEDNPTQHYSNSEVLKQFSTNAKLWDSTTETSNTVGRGHP